MSLLCPLDSPPYSIRPIPFWILRALCSLRLFPASRQVICLFPTARERSISSVDGPCSHSEEGPGRPRRGAVRTLRVEPASQKCAPRRPPLGPARVLRGILGRRRSIAPAGTHLRTGAAHGTNRSPIPQNRYRPGTACPSEGRAHEEETGHHGRVVPAIGVHHRDLRRGGHAQRHERGVGRRVRPHRQATRTRRLPRRETPPPSHLLSPR